MEQPDELVLDFDDDLLDTSTSSAPVGDTDESTAAYSIAPTACEGADGTTGHEKETEDNRENDEPASDDNILDRSFEVDDVKMSEEDNAEEHVDEHSDQKKDDSFLDDEKRALIEVEVEKEIRRGIRSSDPQESASDDDASSGSEDSDDESSASSSDSQYTSSEDESPDSAKNSPPPKKSTGKERHTARTERPGSNLRKRRRASSRSASPLSRSQQGSLRVVVNNERGRRVHQSNNDYHGAMEGAKKSKRLCADSSAVNNVLKDAKFFLIKSANMENILISQSLNVWATTKFNDKMLSENFHRVRNVILIFSVEKSGAFQGFARLRSASQRDHKTVNWVLPPNFPANRLGGIFRLKWITRQELPFTSAAHLHNPLNEDKPIKVGRDGTEIQGLVARRLCGMFPLDADIDLTNMGEASGRGMTSSTVTSSIRDRRRSSPLHSSSAKMKSRHERSRSKEDRRKGSRHDRPEYRSRDRKMASNGRPLHASGDIPPLSSVVSVPRRPRESYPPMQPSGYASYIDPYGNPMQLMPQQQMYHASAGGGPMSVMPHFAYMSHHKFPVVVPTHSDYGPPAYHRDDRRPPPSTSHRKRSPSPYASNGGDYKRRYRTSSDGRGRPEQSFSSSRDRRRPSPSRHRTSSRR